MPFSGFSSASQAFNILSCIFRTTKWTCLNWGTSSIFMAMSSNRMTSRVQPRLEISVKLASPNKLRLQTLRKRWLKHNSMKLVISQIWHWKMDTMFPMVLLQEKVLRSVCWCYLNKQCKFTCVFMRPNLKSLRSRPSQGLKKQTSA